MTLTARLARLEHSAPSAGCTCPGVFDYRAAVAAVTGEQADPAVCRRCGKPSRVLPVGLFDYSADGRA